MPPNVMSHILIIEDEEVIRSALRRLLERHGHKVSEAASIEDALSLDLADFHLILSDLRLPGAGSGFRSHADPGPRSSAGHVRRR